MLFDISPDEPEPRKTGKARARGKAAPPPAETAEVEIAPIYLGQRAARPALGTIDGPFACADGACGAFAHDVLDDEDGEWLIECAICGTRQRVAAIRNHLKPRGEQFTVSDGRFAGLTLDEIERQPRGREWLAWAVAEHPRQAVREAVRKHALTVVR